jgi:hypothetical protein
MSTQADAISAGDIVLTPGSHLGIVVGIYGLGYCEVLINKGTKSARILPFRHIDLRKLPQQDDFNKLQSNA